MKRLKQVMGIFIIVVGVCLVVSYVAFPRFPTNPDIILVTVDTLRADHLGCYGYKIAQTPNIDRLAERGTVFFHATTPLPRTTPALASLLTGLWPHHHDSREVGQSISSVPLLSEILKRRGYITLGVSASSVASTKVGLDRGFDQFVLEINGQAELITRQALDVFQKFSSEKPTFLWIHYKDPHSLYFPPSPWRDNADGKRCMELVQSVVDHHRWLSGHVFSDQQGIASHALDSCTEMYDAEIAYTDFHIGQLFAGLEQTLRFEEMLIIFTSDHGENLGEDALFYEHGPSLHDASVRVPLIIAGPGIAQQVDDQIVRLEDIMPTLLELLGEPRKNRPTMDGTDFSGRLSRWKLWRPDDNRVALVESGSSLHSHNFSYIHSGRADAFHCLNGKRFSLCGKPGEEPKLYDHVNDPFLKKDVSSEYPEAREHLLQARKFWRPEEVRERAVRTVRFKLVERPLLDGGYRQYLYDLEKDPEENKDVSSAYPNMLARLQTLLNQWSAELPAYEFPNRSPEELETLRSLGYIQ